jgi:hypothetical protein
MSHNTEPTTQYSVTVRQSSMHREKPRDHTRHEKKLTYQIHFDKQ